MTLPGPLFRRGDVVEVLLQVKPGARRDAIGEIIEDSHGQRRLLVAVIASAREGAANRAIVRLLAKTWRIAPSTIELTSGHTGRRKRVRLAMPPNEATALLRLYG